MLYNIMVGAKAQQNAQSKFDKIEDKWGNTYLSNQKIKQKMRLGKSLSSFEYTLSSEEEDGVLVFSNVKGYTTPDRVVFSNNYNNMNLSMMTFQSNNDTENFVSKTIVYLTLNLNTLVLINYEVLGDAEIIQTYRSHNERYVGCALCTSLDVGPMMKVHCMMKDTHTFVDLTINRLADGTIKFIKTPVTGKEDLSSRAGAVKRLGKKLYSNHFNMHVNKLVTNVFIVNEDESAQATEFLKANKPNANLLVLGKANIKSIENPNSDDEEMKKIRNATNALFDKQITDKRVRAVTFYGNTRLPKSFTRERKILYLFNVIPHEDGTYEMKCLKCN